MISPRSGIELGGTEVYVGGPCYKPGYTIICRFMGNLTSKAKYISSEQASCITPPLYVSGRILFELSLDGGVTYNFNGSFRSSKCLLWKYLLSMIMFKRVHGRKQEHLSQIVPISCKKQITLNQINYIKNI